MEAPPRMTPEQHADAAAEASRRWGYQIDIVSAGSEEELEARRDGASPD
jgi:hypothetical protein